MKFNIELKNVYDSSSAILEMEQDGKTFVAWETLDGQIIAAEKENYDVNCPDKMLHVFKDEDDMYDYLETDTDFHF